jgi:hypothetical protein
MKFFRSLIPSLPFLLYHLRLPSPEADPTLFSNSTEINSSSTELSQLLTTNANDLLRPFITPRHIPRKKHSLSIVEKACLLIRCLAMDVLLLRVRFRGSVFIESLPSNESIRHIM